MTREDAYDLVTENLSNFGSFLGIGLAILAIIFTIIQLSYKRLTIIELVIEETYFVPLFYFGTINIALSSVLLLFRKTDSLLSDFSYTRLAIIESYLFYGFVVGMCIVFYRTLQFVNFQKILQVYLSATSDLVTKESRGKLADWEKNLLEDRRIEIHGEVMILIAENKVRNFNLILSFYSGVLFLPTTSFLQGFERSLAKWFVAITKTQDEDAMRNLYERWYNFYQFCLFDRRRMRFVVNLPLYVYFLYIESRDKEIEQFIREEMLIRTKEQSIAWFHKQADKKGEIALTEIRKSYDVIEVFQELIFRFVKDDELLLLGEALKQLKLGRQLIGTDDEYDSIGEMAYLPMPTNEDGSTDLHAHGVLLADYYYEIPFYVFCYLAYMIAENIAELKDKKQAYDLLRSWAEKVDRRMVVKAIAMFEQSDIYSKMPIAEWIRKDQLPDDGEVHFLENSEVVLGIGYMILLSRLSLSDIELPEELLHKSENFTHFLRQVIDRYKNNSVLPALMGVTSKAESDVLLANITKWLDDLKFGMNKLKDAALVDATISPERVIAFQQMIFKQWNERRGVGRLFEAYGAVENDPPDKLVHVGMNRINLRKGKGFFLKERNAYYVGDFGFGHSTNDQVWKYFVHVVTQNAAVKKIQQKSFIDGFDLLVDQHPHITHALLSQANYILAYKALMESGTFTTDITATGLKNGGLYRDKLLITPFIQRSNDQAIVGLQMPGAMIMKRRTDKNWMDDKLQVDVIEIDDSNVIDTLLRSSPPGDPNNKDQVQEAKTGILIEINETILFQIVEPKNVVIIQVKERIG